MRSFQVSLDSPALTCSCVWAPRGRQVCFPLVVPWESCQMKHRGVLWCRLLILLVVTSPLHLG